jgi:hypothetical protein
MASSTGRSRQATACLRSGFDKNRSWPPASVFIYNKAAVNAAIMATNVIQEKHQLHKMVDLLAPEQAHALRALVEVMLDTVARALANAAVDEEPLTRDDEKALDEAREWLKHNKGIPHEQVLAELGITSDDIENYKG